MKNPARQTMCQAPRTVASRRWLCSSSRPLFLPGIRLLEPSARSRGCDRMRHAKLVPAVRSLEDIPVVDPSATVVLAGGEGRAHISTYLAMASRNRDLYSFGLVTVGRLRPPPAKPRSLIKLSSFLSHVYVRMQSMMPAAGAGRGAAAAAGGGGAGAGAGARKGV